ncbi:hypothetical protein MRX96_017805 [Rhipicephalus microplus]|uniref:Uncharacterized protein n=1 Tax=Rhipicephalus microplus TaxID=6941 RepID=A0A9J6EHA1_RHIMP|nr:hypothetical protein HPB51_016631 [Rhipicephalus microplus]
MARNIVEELLLHLRRMSTRDLLILDCHNVSWMPQLCALPPPVAYQRIIRALLASPSVPVFMERFAWLHCWLVQTGRMGPWMLLRFGASAQMIDPDVVVGCLANALQCLHFQTTFSALRDGDTHYVCVINDYANPGSEKGGAMFLVLWRGQRFAAVRAMTRDELIVVTAALFIALRGESVELLFGDPTDLGGAFLAGRVVTEYNANFLAQVIWRL